MLRKHAVILGLASLWLGVSDGVAGPAESCAELQGSKPQEHLTYLQRDRTTLTTACVVYAADQIGLHKYSPAVKTLVQYLDYRLPDSPALRIGTPRTPYPVTTALFEIGKPAVPDLVEAIGSSTTSEIARTNAIEVIFSIHRSNVAEAVRVLMRASKASPDYQSSMRLYDAARKTADMCKEPMRNTCMNALQ